MSARRTFLAGGIAGVFLCRQSLNACCASGVQLEGITLIRGGQASIQQAPAGKTLCYKIASQQP